MIAGYAALARRNLAAGETQRVVDSLGKIEAGVKLLGAALGELLDLAQLHAGQQLALRRTSIDLVALLERFHRATNVGGSLPGTGLGLAGARDVIEQHKGEIYVQGEEGHGSVFTVRLPLNVPGTPGVQAKDRAASTRSRDIHAASSKYSARRKRLE